jgi:hypothetical protein
MVQGTVASRPFDALDAIFSKTVPNNPALLIQISDFAAACGEQDAGMLVVPGQVLLLTLAMTASDGGFVPITGAGTYPIIALDSTVIPADFSFMAYDFADSPTCNQDGDYAGQSGSVTIDVLEADSVTGSFDVVLEPVFGLPDAGTPHLTGIFDAVACNWLNPANTTCH